ncbi:T9SS type A sorting domain-containing protein [Flavobacterium degerlachei]|jgi:uncharacterized repeat protein (TIGR01451 family)|uniref:Conserved repeat domain-containing protein/Por secretion system C-terminal sorting domain-containing protein n=1 Tax=Flavobacterium degerlachei TaxID=229203 RepID=A0A1H2U4K6_9FLAO|nr:T9SS type A sorting domain-containing protein [Flavobacterium degerlachei]SDW50529.1 conserved repeat domain-containing protein/Por secretion system C-terminal sorting domain-containing protein [Flavobacterium degerlachei]
MKKFYFLLLAFFIFSGVNAQIIEFKSPTFKERLLIANTDNDIAKDLLGNSIKIDENNDKEIQLEEALKISALDLKSTPIYDISGIEFFTNLKSLNCWNTQISTLNISTLKELKYLDCAWNSIKTLDVSSLKNLETIVCTQGSLTSINLTGLDKLHHLHLDGNALVDLNLSGLTSLKYIDCGYNRLTKLDLSGITQLEDLICNDNKITSFTNLADCPEITRMWVQQNELSSIDFSKCSKLKDLWADDNKLVTIDLTVPKDVGNASFGNNNLSSVKVDGYSNIKFIRLSNNNFTTIDLSPFIQISDAECSNNSELTTIFAKNGRNEGIAFEGCPKLKYICNDDIKDSVVEWYLKYYNYTNISLNSYCTFEPGGVFYTIKGKTILDSDNNGCDSSDLSYSNLNFSITNGLNKGNLISNKSGDYNIPVGEGTHTITPILENPIYFSVSPTSIDASFPSQNSPFTQNFCITPNGAHPDLEVTLLPIIPARPGFDATYKIIYKNKGTNVQSGSLSLSFNDAVLDYISAVPAVNSQATDKLSWDYINLQPFETREIVVTLNVNSPMETPAVNNGDRLSFNALINPVTGDEKPVDNSFALRQSVVGSYDPNDKTCLEGDVITPSLIGEYVHYLIRFENTGTYPAQNIVVKDLIDLGKFDISSLTPTKGSHEFVTKISDGNKVEFIFENINLPFDDANNDGYIAFKIKTLPTLVVGDTFQNEANIYFDYNFPILTNKATSTFKALATSDFEFSNYFSVFPNPVKEILNINYKNSIEVQSIAIYDILGQMVIAVPDANAVSKIDVSKLATGKYFLKMNTDKGSSNMKFIKN